RAVASNAPAPPTARSGSAMLFPPNNVDAPNHGDGLEQQGEPAQRLAEGRGRGPGAAARPRWELGAQVRAGAPARRPPAGVETRVIAAALGVAKHVGPELGLQGVGGGLEADGVGLAAFLVGLGALLGPADRRPHGTQLLRGGMVAF